MACCGNRTRKPLRPAPRAPQPAQPMPKPVADPKRQKIDDMRFVK